MKNAIAVVLLSLMAACYGCGSSAVLMGSQTVGIEYAEENARLACRYMRGLIGAD